MVMNGDATMKMAPTEAAQAAQVSAMKAVEISHAAAAAEMEEYRVAVAALSKRVAEAGPAPSKGKGKGKGKGKARRRTMGCLTPECGPMVWYASPVRVLESFSVMACVSKKGALVRAGIEKSSGLVLKLAAGMEVVVDAEAFAVDGTPRLRVVDPIRGWASAKTFEAVASATAASFEDEPRERRDVGATAWASSTGGGAYFAEDGQTRPPRVDPEALAAALRVHGGHDCGGGGSGHETVPIFVLPRARSDALAALPLDAAARARPPTVEAVEGVAGCFFASGVFSPAQCDQLVSLSVAMGSLVAQTKGDDLRRNATQQCVFADADGAIRAALNAVLPLVPCRGDGAWTSAGSSTQNGAAPKTDDVPSPGALYGLNAKCRFLRYAVGDSVQPHHDTAWKGCDASVSLDAVVPDALSWMTCIVYLNDDFDGGETTFFVDRGAESGDYGRVSVRPKKGAALLFFHGHHRDSPLHEGSSVTAGPTKHVLRTDVLYKSAPRDSERAPPLRSRSR